MFEKLQNGSDVRGVACEGVTGEKVNFTCKEADKISQAFTIWLSDKLKKDIDKLKIGVGHDSRITADTIKNGVIDGAKFKGASVYDASLASTPAMFMAIIFDECKYDGTIMITASHLPFNRNGMKFFDKDGGLEKEDITKILEIAQKLSVSTKKYEADEKINLIDIYAKCLRDKIIDGVDADNKEKPLEGLKILVDAGNGAGGFFEDKVIKPLGADTVGSQFLEPDGMFPNHIPNPEDKKAMNSIVCAVKKNNADMGIIFDTDVDRMSAVLSGGQPVNRDCIIAMMSAILAKDYKGSVIVTDSVTSDRLTEFIEDNLKMKHHRFKRGYKNVINESKRLNSIGIESCLAIETSGHGAMKENYFLDDGAYMAVKMLIACAHAKKDGNTMASYIKDFKDAFEEREYRFEIKCDNFHEYGENVLAEFEKRALKIGYNVIPDSYEGVRISFNDNNIKGWLLFRLSLHDPKMPLNMEGSKEGDCDKMFEIVKNLIKDFDKLVTVQPCHS